jgi:hypothetical protein
LVPVYDPSAAARSGENLLPSRNSSGGKSADERSELISADQEKGGAIAQKPNEHSRMDSDLAIY